MGWSNGPAIHEMQAAIAAYPQRKPLFYLSEIGATNAPHHEALIAFKQPMAETSMTLALYLTAAPNIQLHIALAMI